MCRPGTAVGKYRKGFFRSEHCCNIKIQTKAPTGAGTAAAVRTYGKAPAGAATAVASEKRNWLLRKRTLLQQIKTQTKAPAGAGTAAAVRVIDGLGDVKGGYLWLALSLSEQGWTGIKGVG